MKLNRDNGKRFFSKPFYALVTVFTLLLTAHQGGDANANDAAFGGSGATVYAVKENRVRMEKEVVLIRYNHQAAGPRGDWLKKWLADCTFTFINLTDKPVDVQMGFPDTQVLGEEFGLPGGKPPVWASSDFKVWVNGDPAPSAHKDVEPLSGLEIAMPKDRRAPLHYPGAYIWQVHFEPKERITVSNSYAFGGGTTVQAINELMRDKTSNPLPTKPVFWEKSRPKRCEWDFGNSAYSWVDYIVTTGLTWAGPIGEADIAIEIPPYMFPHLLLPAPGGFTMQGGFVRWHFKQWRPKSEVALFILIPVPQSDCEELYDTRPPLFDTLQQAETWVGTARAHRFDRYTVSLIRNAYLAKYGHRFNDEKLQDFFEHQHWYKAKPGMDLKAIPAKDQHIITLLEQLENSLE